MSVIIFFLLLFGGCASGVVFQKMKFEKILPFVIFVYIEIMFLFGLMDHLHAGFAVVCFAAAASFLCSIYKSLKAVTWYEDMKNVFTVGFVAFVVLYFLYSVSIVGLIPHHNDEFSFWAVSVKEMWMLDVFYCDPIANQTSFANYTPGMQLFEFISLGAGGKFSDWRMYAGYWTFIISLGCYFLHRFEWRKRDLFQAIIYISGFFIFGGIFYTQLYDNLMVDFPLGCIFAFGLAIAILPEDKTGLTLIQKTIFIGLISNMIILVKSAGILYAAILIVAYAITLSWNKQTRKVYLVRACSIGIPFLTSFLWSKKYTSYDNHMVTSSSKYDLSEFLGIITGRINGGYRSDVKTKFIDYILHTKTNIGNIELSNMSLMIVYIIVFFLIYLYCRSRDIWLQKPIIIAVFAGSFIYWVGLLSTYMYVLSEGDALGLASIQRFLNIYNVTIFLTILFISAAVIEMHYRDWILWVVIASPFFLVDLSIVRMLIDKIYPANAQAAMGSLTSIAEKFDTQGNISSFGERGTVLLIHNGADYPHVAINGFAYQILPYYYVPWECMYGDAPTFENDAYTHIYTVDEFHAHVVEIEADYIAVDLLDTKFVELYSELFDHSLENGQIYRVHPSGKFELIH